MTSLVAAHIDLSGVVAAAGGRVAAEPWSPENAVGGRTAGSVTVALAAGKAFSFCYAEHPELLRAAGADVVEFDPLTDPLPPGTAALVLPGGFPEEFGTELSANDRARHQIASAGRRGGTRARRMRRPDVSGGRTRGLSDVRCARRLGAVHRQADTGLPGRRRDRGLVAVHSGRARRRT